MLAVSAVIGTIIASGVAIPAQASDATAGSVTTVSQSCLQQVVAIEASTGSDVNDQVCQVTTGPLTLGQETTVSVAMAQAATGLSTMQRASLVTAAAAGTVRSKAYSQFTTGGAYTVTHNGRFYYDGSRVWVGTTYRGYRGSHSCFVNYSVASSISKNYCSESGSTTTRYMKYGWTVTLIVQGFPVAYGYSMTANLFYNGSASGFGVTTG